MEKFLKDCLPWEEFHAGAGEECEDTSPKEQGPADKMYDPHSSSPCAVEREKVETSGSKVEPKKNRGVRGRFF